MKDYMQNVVENGTAAKLSGQSYNVAGKTGSAEFGNVKGQSHAWFVGFSPVEDSKIVVSIVVEEAGAGSEYAVPIAKKIFDAYYN
jgi:peptidoglycan glycosyltransferase